MTIQLHPKLSIAGLLQSIKHSFSFVKDPIKSGKKYGLVDCLMSGMAIFGMKYPSLLQFEQSQSEDRVRHNLKSLYGVAKAPSDTQLRQRLDEVELADLVEVYKSPFKLAQRHGVTKKFQVLDGYHPVAVDATGIFSSHEIHCQNCCVKNHKDGSKTYHHQILSAVMVNPGMKQVMPLISEPITKQDGATKNDCELNAAKRLYPALRSAHPKLKMLVIQDNLYATAPNILELKNLGFSYLIVVKPTGDKALFEWVKEGRTQLTIKRDNITYHLSWFNGAPLNDTHHELKVNFLECYETHYDAKTKIESEPKSLWTWITDIQITKNNVLELAQTGRARWHIENETYNTLKNQGYHFEHNFGHGDKNLSTVFAHLMMLAFLIDQIQELCCEAFQAALKKEHSKKSCLWQRFRIHFLTFYFASWTDFLNYIADPSDFDILSNKGIGTICMNSS